MTSLLEGLALGLATGSVCLVTCSPIYLPFLLSEKRKLGGSLLAVLEISAGRFFSYMAFGAAAGYLGANIGGVNRTLFTATAYLLLSVYMILTAVRTRRAEHKCHVPKWMSLTRSGFLLGVLSGLNLCPAFLIALSSAIHLAGALQGMMLFLGFFFGTSVFLIPLAFLSLLSNMRHLKSIARVAAVLVAVWFTGKGAVLLWQHFHPRPDGFIKHVAVAWAEPNAAYFATLADSLATLSPHPVLRLAPGDSLGDEPRLWFADTALPPERFAGRDVVPVDADYPLAALMNTLRAGTQGCPEEETGDNPLCSTCPVLTGDTQQNLAFVQPLGRMIDVFAPGQSLTVVSSRAHRRYFAALADSLQVRATGEVSLAVSPDDSLAAQALFLDATLWEADSTRWLGCDRFVVDPGYPLAQLLRHAGMFVFRTEDSLHWRYRN
ncbi:MAG: sulfite exporter TauE/SafE family protein [Candidatus Cloacimonetes bacterium]|nr:sulfite exporter TauE/SafE family protein [Candidatus Cloacimonadota bacterium]